MDDRGPDGPADGAVRYLFPVEIEVRSVPPATDPRELIDEAFRTFAASLERG